jgi:hypothetical protein
MSSVGVYHPVNGHHGKKCVRGKYLPPHGMARMLDLHNRLGIAAAVATQDGLA